MFSWLQKRYFDVPLSHGLVSLYTSKTIVMIATALLGIFLPIFLYELFDNDFGLVAIYYGLGHLFYGVLVIVGAKFLNNFGFRRALRVSVFLGALYYSIFYFIDKGNWSYLIPFALLALLFFRLSYWLPYHTDFAKFSDRKNRGRQLSMFFATRFALGIFIPVIAGFVISRFGFNILFIIAIILYLVSGIPYLTIPKTYEKFAWGFKETWRKIVSKERRRVVSAYFADGAESTVGLIVWPIFIFQILKGNYLSVGIVFTLILGATAVMQLILGRYIDLKTPKEKVLWWGSLVYAVGWVVKIFIATAFQVFIVGTYHRVARIFIRTPFDAITYEIAADEGHYVDEFTVLHEVAVNLGKASMLALVIPVSLFLEIQWVFPLAALAAIAFNLLRGQKAIEGERHNLARAF